MAMISLNIPHSSVFAADLIPYNNSSQLEADVRKWTDWYTDSLFLPEHSLCANISTHIFPYSRFFIDVERLVDDEKESIGQGIIYTNFNGNIRSVGSQEKVRLMEIYYGYIAGFYLNESSLLIDCHSFPSLLAPEIDICIGYNNDESKPECGLIARIADIFKSANYRVAFNTPYSNALTPSKPINYKSFMIEVNKATYMDEETLKPHEGFSILRRQILKLYQEILNKPIA